MVSPVAGFLPIRALRFTSFNLPIPGKVKAPVAFVLEMAKSAKFAKRSAACFYVRSFASATAAAICDFVNGLSAMILLVRVSAIYKK